MYNMATYENYGIRALICKNHNWSFGLSLNTTAPTILVMWRVLLVAFGRQKMDSTQAPADVKLEGVDVIPEVLEETLFEKKQRLLKIKEAKAESTEKTEVVPLCVRVPVRSWETNRRKQKRSEDNIKRRCHLPYGYPKSDSNFCFSGFRTIGSPPVWYLCLHVWCAKTNCSVRTRSLVNGRDIW